MNTPQHCLDCGRCVQRTRQANMSWRGILCLLTQSPFRLRLMLLERLTGECAQSANCPRLIWRG
ncbi:hypothetical protein LQ939_06860 [Pantoea alhagi]|uniref:hypothetical protein n=1 Tax=Pantoea alhagi TaxID=1891675 RepID=UPI00202AE605|nr:hypothetical protein [Pantoea alhagi]URQ61986.1 hypothetical protein LQ939_06860 [Pantoea alhagi]